MMERKDIAALAQDIFDEFLAHPPTPPDDFSIRMTSGTSGTGPMLTLWQTKNGAEWRAKDMRRFVVAFGPRAMRMGNVLFFRNNPDTEGALVLPLDANDLDDSAARLLADFDPDSFYAFPSFAARIAEHMSDAMRGAVHTLGFSGEALSKTLREFFSARFVGARLIATFGTAETGVITAYPCEYLLPGEYHPREGVTLEVEDADESGVGYMLISKDLLFGRRMERYRIGDMARMLDHACPCGAGNAFEILGRAGYDFMKIAGAILRREEFDRAALSCAALFDDYRIEADEVLIGSGLKGRLALTVYRAEGGVDAQAVEREFAKRVYLTPSRTLADLIAQGLFLPLDVHVSSEPLPQKGKSMKLSPRKP